MWDFYDEELVHFVGLGAVNWLATLHGVNSIKFNSAQQAKEIYEGPEEE